MRKSGIQNRKEQDKTRNNEKEKLRMEQQRKITRHDVQQQHKKQSTVGNNGTKQESALQTVNKTKQNGKHRDNMRHNKTDRERARHNKKERSNEKGRGITRKSPTRQE